MSELAGLRIVVTRAAHQADELARPLRALGANVILLPMAAIKPPADPEPLRCAARHANSYDWIIFTSANAVDAFRAELPGLPNEISARVATIGAATREAAEQKGFTVNLVPASYVAEALVNAFCAVNISGKRMLIPSAAVTRDLIPGELRKLGAQVDVIEAYRNEMPAQAGVQAADVFSPPCPDWVLFASSSAVDNLVTMIGADALRSTKIGTIGPVTSATVRKHGLTAQAEAVPHTIEGLVEAVRRAQRSIG